MHKIIIAIIALLPFVPPAWAQENRSADLENRFMVQFNIDAVQQSKQHHGKRGHSGVPMRGFLMHA